MNASGRRLKKESHPQEKIFLREIAHHASHPKEIFQIENRRLMRSLDHDTKRQGEIKT